MDIKSYRSWIILRRAFRWRYPLTISRIKTEIEACHCGYWFRRCS